MSGIAEDVPVPQLVALVVKFNYVIEGNTLCKEGYAIQHTAVGSIGQMDPKCLDLSRRKAIFVPLQSEVDSLQV